MMPLQSSGIIVVEKPKTAVTTLSGSAVTTEVAAVTVNVASQQPHQKLYQTQQLTTKATRSGAATSIGKYFEYYGTNDVHQPQQQQQHHQKQQQQQQQYNVACSKSNTTSRSQTQLPLMRRAQQRNSSNSLYSSNKCNINTTITGGTASIKIKQINVKQQQQQQQHQVQMNQQQQQHQLIQHTTIHQQQHQIHQQQSQQLATQLQQQHQSKQQQHVQKQHQLPQQQMHSQQQQQQQHHQQQPQPQQQVIQVSEEFIEQATASGATNMMISATTGEVLNPQIFKIVATDGTTGNMIIDSGSAAAVGGQSKVLLSNLTVLAKQAPTTPSTSTATTVAVGAAGNLNAQQQHTIGVSSGGTQPQQAQTINYMSAKNLSYLTTAAAAATPITGGGKTQKYTVTGTYKTGVKQQPQQLTSTTYIQQSQQQTNQTMSQGSQQTQQLYQKLSVPRHVQMLTRVQAVVQQPSASGTSMTTNTAAQQQQQTQMLVQPVVGGQKYLSSSATTKSVSVTGTAGNMLKKSNNLKISHSNSKVVNNIQMQQQQGVKTTYITQQQQQQYQLHQPQYQSGGSSKIKTSKLLKQYNNMINNSSSSSTSGINMLQQQPLGTYTISSSGGAHKLQQTTKVTKMTSNKYATHQQQLQHVATLPQGTHLHHKTVPQQQQFSTGSNVVTLATSGSGGSSNNNQTINVTNTAGSTIKFVNSAHATVIQQHQTTSLPMQHSKVSLRQQQTQQQQQQIQFVDAPTTTIVKDNSTGNTIYQQQAHSGNNNNNVNTQSLLNDDIMIVNGTQMTDELSARILQSMAQKSFSNHQRYQQQQQTKSVAMPPPNAQQTQQQQQIVLQQHSSPTSVLLSPKEYPVYSTAQLSAQQQTGQQQQLSAPTTINTQYTTAVHQTPTAATAYLPVSAAAHTSSAGSGALYSTISTSGASIGRQTHSAPGSRTHSLERNKSYEASTTITRKTAVDYYKANNNNVGGRGHHHSLHASHATPALSSSLSNIPLETQQQQQQQQHSSAQIIHLQTLKSSLAATTAAVAAGNSSYTIATNNSAANNTAAASANADDEDIIGEEVRPVPVNTQDLRLRILHAVQQDHTYANAMPSNLSGADSVKSGGGVSVQQLGKVGIAGSNSAMLPGTATQSHLQSALAGNVGGSQQWSLGGIGVTVASGQTGLGNVLPTPPSSGQSTYTLHGQQIPRVQQDDDAHSAISNGSRVATGDIDPGEETETAPEAEAEDDSVTRCICDLTHDDGYMICCDKCFAWQHVDCMGIDRQNIPDEYQCEVCQPRQVDKARARALQLMKRKEQTQLLLSAQSAHATGSSGAYLGGGASGGGAIMVGNYQLADGQQRHIGGATSGSFMLGSGGDGGTIHGLPNNTTLSSTKKGKVLKKTSKDTIGGKKSKKADKLGVGSNLGGKPPRKESATAKKTTKRKTKSSDGLSASASAAEKHAANLRQWIENYELAVTNHYSPELRARLHAITKQPSLLQSILNTENRALKECCNNGLENRATTVPHAGGKILISNMDISPSCPIFELRGKYMLSPQYKTQNASVNMNSPPPSNYLAASLKAHKTPGPFIFFYQLPDAEAPMQTMNQDGSYPPLPPQPAYLKGPEICVDTRTYGNEARFVRRSCRPNAEIQHLFEKGTIHLFIVATTRIRASTEITIKHEPHDLLAIENKKATSSNCIVQPTSTACACGLLKDCLFGPPPTQQSLAAGGVSKSSSRKSLLSTTLNGGVQLNSSAAAMQLTMGGLPPSSNKKKGPAQNINRNRSTSSSGDSGIGAAAGGMNSPSVALPAAPLNMNTNVSNHTFKSNGGLNILSGHALATSTAVPNSNGSMSATSSVSSVMHDSGICTSSSSPSVSIPSPSTLHIHSPTQQQSQQQTVVPASTAMQRGSNALFIQHSPQQQQQHQQILGALPTPLLLSPPQQLAHPQGQGQAQVLTQSQVQPQQQQQQQHTVVDAVENNINAPLLQEVVTTETTTVSLSQTVSQPEQQSSLPIQQLPEHQKHEQQLNQQQMQSESICSTVSDASLAAAAALQSLNTAVTLTEVVSASDAQSTPPSNTNNMAITATEATTPDIFDVSDAEQQPKQPHQQTQQQQQTQFYVTTSMQPPHQDMVDGSLQEALQQQTTTTTSQLPPPPQTHGAVVASPNSGSKSPQKLIVNTGGIGACLPSTSARIHKTSGKSSSSRSTSFSEDDHQQQHPQHNTSSGSVNDDAANTPTSKEKTKLSREERKMEAILRAIEKMERNQQRKNQQSKSGGTASSSAAKRRNSNSNSPTTPTKRIVGELSASSNSGRVSAVAARKKKRKTHKAYSGHSAQARKRRKSRINSSNESADGAGSNGAGLATTIDTSAGEATVHSETESASLLSPAAPLAATGPSYQPQQEHNEVVADTAASTNEDQAAGLLLAFANPNLKMSPTSQKSPQVSSTTVQQQQQFPTHYSLDQLKSPQHRTPTGGGNGASPPATPVSSACLLIEAAVGPLQEHMDGSPSGEFKYPNKTKTKKVLMSNWLLNQVDADTSGSDSSPSSAPTPPPSGSGVDVVPAVAAAEVPTATATLGLDSLVQAATMCDYSKQQPEADATFIEQVCASSITVDEPQNLSMAAQKVEEFIQQTERSSSGVYNQTTAAAATGSPRNLLHLPLQVSTCSNNSSVKKRWLRQAISEETTTDETMTPTPTAMTSGSLQNVSPTTAAAAAHLNAVLNVPNGFTTPLKKRRLILSGGEKEEEDVGAPSTVVFGIVKTELPMAPSATERDATKMLPNAVSSDVDVMNIRDGDTNRGMKNEVETSDDEEADEEEYDEEEERDDVDVVGGVGVNELNTTTKTLGNTGSECHPRQEIISKAEQEEVEEQRLLAAEEMKSEHLLIDQDDDVDILRSPSPGHQQMLAAEDNLVKIEPEDTSGGDDVKIDVEREESLAGDKFEELVLMQVKKEETELAAAEQTTTNALPSVVKETKITVEEDEKTVKHAKNEESVNTTEEKFFRSGELDEKIRRCGMSIKLESSHQDMDTTEPVDNKVNLATYDEEMWTAPTEPSALELLAHECGSTASCDEPLKKRPKLEPLAAMPTETSVSSEGPQQTSLLKPLSARMLEMQKQTANSESANNNGNNNKILQTADTLHAAIPKMAAQFTSENFTPTTQVPASETSPVSALTPQPNCITFLAAAAAAAIDRKPPPPPPDTTATTTPVTTQSIATTAPVCDNIKNALPLSPPLSVTSTAADIGSTGTNTSSASLLNCSDGSSASITLAPRKQNTVNNNNNNERKIPLTDDDIHARLHSFHKENILILQSRNNKKSKPNATSVTSIDAESNKSGKLVENKSLSATSYSSHHSHHHSNSHNDAVKSVSANSSKNSSALKSFANSSSSGSSSAKKLRKKERNGKEHSSSSSSRSSSSHSGKLSATNSSSKKVSSSHKKDYSSSTPVSISKQPHSGSSSYNNSNSSSTASGGGDSKDREERRDRDNRERGFDKERHHRHRTTSSSNSSNSVLQSSNTASSTTLVPPPPTSKKRQLNFEQELTKDLPLVNAVTSSSSRHRKDSGSRDSRDDMISSSSLSGSNNSLAARKRRESSSSSGGGSRHRHNSSSSCGAPEPLKDTSTHKPPAAEHNGILAVSHVAPLPPATYVREHVTIPHFNNVVVTGPPPPLMAAYFSGIGAVAGSNVDASMGTPIATYVPTPALPPSSNLVQQPTHSLLKTLPMQPALSHLAAAVSHTLHAPPPLPPMPASSGGSAAVLPSPSPSIVGGTTIPLATHSPGAAGSLPSCGGASTNSTASTYNSIYGKLRDNIPAVGPPPAGAATVALSGAAGAPCGITPAAVQAGVSANISLSEYLDTKVKSYSTTMGAYATQSHTYISGSSVSSNTGLLQGVNKPANNSTSSNSSGATENISVTSTPVESPVVSKLPTSLKLPLTRTASHDPRLNPQLNAPEPPPAPKRKLSINEYRKRMQLSTDSTTLSMPDTPATVSAPTTPAANMTPNLLNNSFVQAYNSIVNTSPEEMARQLSLSPITVTLNKYTLNSPERRRHHSGSEKEQHSTRHSASYDDVVGLLNSSTGSSSCGNMTDTSSINLNNEDDGKKGQFSAAPTLLEKQQEKLCERLKLLRNMNKSVTSLSSATKEFAHLKKDCDLYANRTNSISSTENLDNCLEEISSSSSSSSSTSRASSRDASPERNCVSTNVCRKYTSTTSSNHKWPHEGETANVNVTNAGTPTRDDATVARGGSESAT